METEDVNMKDNICDVTSGSKFIFEFEQYSWDHQPNLITCDLITNAKSKIESERQTIEKYIKAKEVLEQEKLKQTHLLDSLLQTKEEVMKILKLTPNT